MSSINQKEYLKKYLGIGKAPGEKKKKKRKEKTFGTRLKIVDDDIEASISQEIQDDLSGTNEDAPLVVAVIDERPPSLRIDDETKNNLWKPIGEPDNVIEDLNFKLGSTFQLNKSKLNFLNAQTEFKKPGNIQSLHTSQSKTRKKYDKTSHDMSPSRKRESVKNEKYNNDSSPPRQRRFEGDSSDQIETEDHNDNKQYKDKDFSPPRRNIHPERSKRYYEDNSSNQTDENIDIFPPRKNDSKKPEKKDVDSSQKNRNSTKPNNRNEDNYPRQRNRDDDISPPRKKNYINDEKVDNHSPARKNIRERDLHQMRRNISYKNKDNSPPRQRNNYLDSLPKKKNDDNLSPPRQIIKRKNCSLSSKQSTSDQGQKKSRWGSPERSCDTPDKVKVTLSGKRAGLQNAKDITKEIISLREKEDSMFSTMSEEISGINAATVVRDRVPRDLEEEALQLKKQKETKEKYDKWGKGLKQVQDHNEKMAEQLYEMSKPLARYADDEDLDKYLKEQEREGDPMLAYIRKKKKKNAIEAGIPEKPTYMGEFMPNRFGIKPGYRWDGVDRSNGYEKKWFEVQNKKKANLEEAHKWSTEDM